VTKQLGTVRELDVLMLLIDELKLDSRYPGAALENLRVAVDDVRDAARERLRARLPLAKLERLADRLERAVRPLESDETTPRRSDPAGPLRTWLWALDARLANRAERARSAIDVAGALYVPQRLHDVRIALKKLRYAAELATEMGRRRMAADVAALKKAQDCLGRLHDLEVLVTWGRGLQASLSPPDLTRWRALGSLVHAVGDDCRQLHGRYMRDRLALIAIASRTGAISARTVASNGRAAG
jgi:CHAD domain-containing protein